MDGALEHIVTVHVTTHKRNLRMSKAISTSLYILRQIDAILRNRFVLKITSIFHSRRGCMCPKNFELG